MTVPPARMSKALHDLAGRDHLSEAVILSTCLRTEVYAMASRFHGAMSDIRNFLSAWGGMAPEDFADQLYAYHEEAAAAHLFKVAAGLGSSVLGESEILGQVGDAWDAARADSAAGPVLSTLFRHALEVGKRVRSETGIARGTTSLSQAAVALAGAQLGSLAGKTTLVLGAGEMGEAMAQALASALKDGSLLVVNRTWSRATQLAARCGGRAIEWSALPSALIQADVLLASTGSSEFLLTRGPGAGAGRPGWTPAPDRRHRCPPGRRPGGRRPARRQPPRHGRPPPPPPSPCPGAGKRFRGPRPSWPKSSSATWTGRPSAMWRPWSRPCTSERNRSAPPSWPASSVAWPRSSLRRPPPSRLSPGASSPSCCTSRPSTSSPGREPPPGSSWPRDCGSCSNSTPSGALLRIATRGSALARWQAEAVARLLRSADPGAEVDLVTVDTTGDRRADIPVWDMGGQGVFVKEVQAAVFDGRADVAVHSAKDLPSTTPPVWRWPAASRPAGCAGGGTLAACRGA